MSHAVLKLLLHRNGAHVVEGCAVGKVAMCPLFAFRTSARTRCSAPATFRREFEPLVCSTVGQLHAFHPRLTSVFPDRNALSQAETHTVMRTGLL